MTIQNQNVNQICRAIFHKKSTLNKSTQTTEHINEKSISNRELIEHLWIR